MIDLKPEDRQMILNISKQSHSKSAERIGSKIREIREFRGLTLSELGERVGLNADRIQKYENGMRKPKADLVIQLATALEVTPLALSELDIESPLGTIYTLFELENFYGLSFFDTDGVSTLSINSNAFPNLGYLEEWIKRMAQFKTDYSEATSEQEQARIVREYKQWKWSFPFSASAQSIESTKESRKEQLKDQIEALKRELEELDND